MILIIFKCRNFWYGRHSWLLAPGAWKTSVRHVSSDCYFIARAQRWHYRYHQPSSNCGMTLFTQVGIIIVKEHATCSALKKEAACPSETLVTPIRTTHRTLYESLLTLGHQIM